MTSTTHTYTDGIILRNGTPLMWQYDGGYVAFNANAAPTSWNFYVTDHLGSTRMVVTSSNAVKETINYYPYGSEMRMTDPAQMTNTSNKERFRFSGKELDFQNGLNMYDFGARMFDVAGVPVWTSVDPLAEDNSHFTPYSYCNGDPVNRVDPDGRNPIYNTNGELIGITDDGLQGEAIIMEQSNYHDKITLDEAMKFQLGEEGLVGSDAQNRFRDSFNNLSKRPDWDGYITLSEANEWYRNGNGETLYADLNKIDLSGIVSLGKNYVGQTKTFNLLFYSDNLNDGLVYGNITLKRYPNNSVRAYADIYDFDMKSWYNPLNWGRNIETIIGKNYAAQGTSYTIYIYGTKKLTPILPWIK